MRSAAAYAPGHVTGFFQISDSASDPLERGSLGAGFSIAAGVTTRIHLAELAPSDPLSAPSNELLRTRVSINGAQRDDAAVSQEVVRLFLRRRETSLAEVVDRPRRRALLLSIEHQVRVPEGSGFGSSGAGALSLAYALNALFDRPLPEVECGQIAHLAEVACGTGLGTVIGEYVGGCEIRTSAGAPGIGRTERFELDGGQTVVCVVYGALSTKAMLADDPTRARINSAGGHYLELLRGEPTVARFLELSREFAEATGLISPRVRPVLELFDGNGVSASMLMFGDGVFTIVPRGLVPAIRRMVDKSTQNGDLLVSTIEPAGGRVIDED